MTATAMYAPTIMPRNTITHSGQPSDFGGGAATDTTRAEGNCVDVS